MSEDNIFVDIVDDKRIYCYHSHLELNKYRLGDCPELERKLSVFDKIYFKSIPKGYIYDEERECLLMPSGLNPGWVAHLTNRQIEHRYNCDPCKKISIRMKVKPRSDLQRDAIAFMSGEGKYEKFLTYSQLVLNLDTGEGKTYAAIALITIKGLRTMIIVNSTKVQSQWVERFLDYTDIDKYAICNFTGSTKCAQFISNPKAFIQYRVFITTHDTLRSFGDRFGWNQVAKMFNSLEIGIKIYDEAHQDFRNIVRVDCYSDTKYTYYLSATFGRSDIQENYIFSRCFKGIPKYEQKQRDKDYKGKPWIVYMPTFYRSHPTMNDIYKMKTNYGFSMARYADYQLYKDDKFYDAINYLVELLVLKKKLKTVLFIATIDGINGLTNYLSNIFPDIKIGPYHSKMDKKEKAHVIDECDLIISTVKSLGTGTDIAGLRAVINTESYRSKIVTEQVMGRLRRIDDSTQCYYVELVDNAFMTTARQQKEREKVLSKIVGLVYAIPLEKML